MSNSQHYRGRFAPSPSGDLHFGSLVAALGSFLDARHHHGQWLVRIEDIDPPREVAGATKSILTTLECFGLNWDLDITYQSQRHQFYQDKLNSIIKGNRAYGCDCTRKMIMQSGGLYQGHCLSNNNVSDPHSIRFKNLSGIVEFNDRLQGLTQVGNAFANEDFILKRKDGLFAYQLVVVLDDIEQNITDIVRGCDLLEVSTRQMTLYQYFNHSPVRYLHLPLIVNDAGLKLSKQNYAKALDLTQVKATLLLALDYLGQEVSLQHQDYSVEALLIEAAKNWNISQIPSGPLNTTKIISN